MSHAWLWGSMRDTISNRARMDSIQSKNRLLLVDGDPKSLRVLDVSLKKAGFEVMTATSGREALALLEADHPDLIISDTDLDEMDGFELCSHIKARPEWTKIPFLFVSGRKSIEDKIRGLELGVDDYLTKPIYIKEIGIRVRTALQRAERERMESRRDTRTRFAGDLSDVGVVDLVQTIELNRKSGIIHIVNRDTRHGSIFFRDGKVIDAEVGRLSGANAIYRLFSWSEGQFAVEFKQIRRHDVIDTPMAPLLMEGMRRLDESTRLLDKLPSPSSVLEVDCHVLAEELAELPDEVNSVLRLCDGARTLQEIVEDSDHPDLEALTIINELLLGEIIFARETQDRGGESEPGERLAHWLAEGDAEDGAVAEEASVSSEFLVPMELAKDTDAVSARTPVPDGSSAPEASDAKPAQVKGVVSVGEGKNSAWLAVPPSVEHVPASPRPEPDLTKVASQAATPGVPAEAQDHVLSAEESLGAALSHQADATTEGSNEFARPADTLKGVPVDNLFAEQETKTDQAPPEAARSEATSACTPREARSTKPLGLAERLLSEDSTVRASAMHEAIDGGGGKVEHPQPSDRNTREYGNPTTATALVNEVVSTSHQSKRESPLALQPERPKKEVDWGKWSTSPATEVPSPDRPAMLVGFDEKAPASLSVGTEPASPPPGNLVPDEVSPHDVGDPPLLADGDVHSEPDETEVSPSQLPARSANDGGAHAVVDSEASQNGATDLASTLSSAQAPPLRTVPTERGSGQARRFLALVAGAFVLGMVGFLALGRKAPQPEDTPPAAVHGATKSPSPAKAAPPPGPVVVAPAPQPVKPSIKAVRALVAASVGKSNKVPVRPGTGPLSAADLRRKCLETDADGKGRAKSVSAACRPALDADPKDVDVMVILARAEIDRGRLVEARSLAKRALAANPQRLDAYVFLGTAEQEAGRIEEARAAYEKYLELAPEGPFAHELRAVLNNL